MLQILWPSYSPNVSQSLALPAFSTSLSPLTFSPTLSRMQSSPQSSISLPSPSLLSPPLSSQISSQPLSSISLLTLSMSSLSLSASYQSFFIILDKIKKTKLPCSWNVLTTECNKPACFYKILYIPSYSQHHLKISHSVVVNLDLSWKITVHGYEVTSEVSSTLFDGIPSVISSSTQLTNVLYRIDALNVCPGYQFF